MIYKSEKMKRILLLTVIMILACQYTAMAQDQRGADKLAAYKIAFFTKRLELTPAEAEKFWPVYNEYSLKKSKIQIDRLSMMRYVKQNESIITGDELNVTADKLTQSYIDESNLEITFVNEIKKILPPAKIIRLYQAEAQYKQQLMQELNSRRQGSQAGRVVGN